MASSEFDQEVHDERRTRGVSGTFIAVCVAIVLLAIAFFAFYEPTGNTFTPWPRNATAPQDQAEAVVARPGFAAVGA
jgi:hypothetical protein